MLDLNLIFTNELKKELNISEWGYTELAESNSFFRYQKWIELKKYLPLNYLADDRMFKRKNLKNYFENFESAIVVVFSYKHSSDFLKQFYLSNESNGLKIASYTLGFDGLDYHLKLKSDLEKIILKLTEKIQNIDYKFSLDIHPVLERELASRAGIGWHGKNSMLITRESGSYFIIGSILTNKKFTSELKKLETDHCGQCTRCADACPTKAIDPVTRTLTAKDCISTYTIEEFKLETIPSKKLNLNSGFIFGCDICQDVCPWNTRLDRVLQKTQNLIPNLQQIKLIDFFLTRKIENILESLQNFSNNEFKHFFKDTSFERSGKRGLIKNFLFYFNNR
jgi:epoxyqueuosine reductase